MPRPKGHSGESRAFLAKLRSMYRGKRMALLRDENPCHTAQASASAAGEGE